MLPSSLVPISRSVMRQKYRAVGSRARSLPRPDDAAHGSTPGTTGHRVLVIGNEYAISWGVRTHALALPGQLARELTARTGLGADVDVIACSGMSIVDVLASLVDHNLECYDAVMVLTGVGDAFQLVPPLQWMQKVKRLIHALTEAVPESTHVILMGIQPVSSVNICHTKEHGVTDRWAEALNEMTESLCLKESHVHYLSAPNPTAGSLDPVDELRFKSPAVYQVWAVSLARHLVPLLAAPATDSLSSDPVAGPLEVRRRLAALDDLHILHTSPEPGFTSTVRRARDLFTTEGAVFSLLTDTHQWNKAMIGFTRTALPIEESFCAITIKSAGAFIVEDAWTDSRIIFDTPVRFYAGYPVTAPDGTRIGALCVFDANPRDASTIVTSFLQELAEDITQQLALRPTHTLTPAT